MRKINEFNYPQSSLPQRFQMSLYPEMKKLERRYHVSITFVKDRRNDRQNILMINNKETLQVGNNMSVASITKAVEKVLTNNMRNYESKNLREMFTPQDIEKFKSLASKGVKLIDIGNQLRKLGYDADTIIIDSVPPHVTIKKGKQKYILVNKQYAEDPDFVINDMAGGLMESKKRPLKEDTDQRYKGKVLKFIDYPWQEDTEIAFVELIEEYIDEIKNSPASDTKRYLRSLYKQNERHLMMVSDAFMTALESLMR